MSASAFASQTFDRNALLSLPEPAGSASISPSARDLVLVSRSGLSIVDLDFPQAEPRFIPYHVPTTVADVQWSPHAFRDSWIVSTAGSCAILWDVAHARREAPLLEKLKGHSRAISDINFSAHHPEILATSSIDSFVFLWDVRTPNYPVLRFADWNESVAQVKFNRQDEHFLATAQGGRFDIWDDRKGAIPVKSINAHATKIYGIDWHREYKENILTCSLDGTIKLWNWTRASDAAGTDPGEPIDRVIRTGYPVWRARYTPFGHGILAMPQRGDNNLHLYDSRTYRLADRDSSMTPVHSFHGHTKPVKEFLWRHRSGVHDGRDMRDFQLASLAADQSIRLHALAGGILEKVGFRKGTPFESSLRFTRKDTEYRSFSSHHESLREHSLGCTSDTFGRIGGRIYSDFPPLAEQVDARGQARASEDNNEEAILLEDDRAMPKSPSARQADSESSQLSGVDRQAFGFPVGETHRKARRVTATSDSGDTRLPLSRFFNTVGGMESFSSRADRADSMVGRQSDATFESFNSSLASDIPQYHTTIEDADEELEALDAFFDEEEDDEDDAFIGAFMRTSRPSRIASSDRFGNRTVQILPPRTCLARWCSNGTLICIFPNKKKLNNELAPKAPDFRDIARFFASGPMRGQCSSEASPPASESSFSDSLPRTKDNILLAPSILFESPQISSRSGNGPEIFATSSIEQTSQNLRKDNGVIDDGFDDLMTAASEPYTTASFGTSGSTRETLSRQLPFTSGSSGHQGALLMAPRTKSVPRPASLVSISNLAALLPSKKYLAKEYTLAGEVSTICRYNAEVCRRHHLTGHARAWQDAGLLLRASAPLRARPTQPNQLAIRLGAKADNGLKFTDFGLPTISGQMTPKAKVQWRIGHPLGGRMINKMMKQFEAQGDEQMLAMLAYVFDLTTPTYQDPVREDMIFPGSNPSSDGGDAEREHLVRVPSQRAAGPISGRSRDNMTLRWKNEHRFNDGLKHESQRAGDSYTKQKHCSWRARYADLLYSWELFEARAQMLKANGEFATDGDELKTSLESEPGPRVLDDCGICGSRIAGDARYCASGVHSIHEACLELFSEQDGSYAEDECPFGCSA